VYAFLKEQNLPIPWMSMETRLELYCHCARSEVHTAMNLRIQIVGYDPV